MVIFRIIASWFYSLVVGIRNLLYDEKILPTTKVGVPTICIGNLAVGGTGKTPHTEYIARKLQDNGYKVAILSRGYKRKSRGFIVADSSSTALSIGDEPMQMYLNLPGVIVAVCKKRVHGIHKLMQLYPDLQCIILDDAFQHRSLQCGLNILLTTADNLYVHDHLLPYGTLRDKKHQSLRANTVIVTKCPDKMLPIDRRVIVTSLHTPAYQTVCFSKIIYDDSQLPADAKNVLLLTGIANSEPIEDYLKRKYDRIEHLHYPDHHQYVNNDLDKITQAFQTNYCDAIITTQKDMVRLMLLKDNPKYQEIAQHLFVLPIRVDLSEYEEILLRQINQYVSENNRKNKKNLYD